MHEQPVAASAVACVSGNAAGKFVLIGPHVLPQSERPASASVAA